MKGQVRHFVKTISRQIINNLLMDELKSFDLGSCIYLA
jgi:hypothetical protein